MQTVNEAVKTWINVIQSITGLQNGYIINGESIRGPELSIVKNGQKVPFTYDETAIVFYNDLTESPSIVSSYKEAVSLQAYELHLIIYGNESKEIANLLYTNFYTRGVLDVLNDNGISLLQVNSPTNASSFRLESTYISRTDLRLTYNVLIETQQINKDVDISCGKINIDLLNKKN